MFKFLFFTFIFINLFFLISCNNNSSSSSENADSGKVALKTLFIPGSSEKQSPTLEEDDDFIAKYVCPNHCNGSGAEKMGNCVVCEMELIENLDY